MLVAISRPVPAHHIHFTRGQQLETRSAVHLGDDLVRCGAEYMQQIVNNCVRASPASLIICDLGTLILGIDQASRG